MIRIGDYVFKNLQQAVDYMACLIGDATDVVKNITGKVTSFSSLPDYKSQTLGTTYAVGTNAPYSYYVATTSGWLFLGVFPKAGPTGANGKDGNSLFFTNVDGNTQTTTINVNNIYNPDNLPITAGNLILMINDNGTFIFSITSVSGNVINVSYLTTLSGIPGPQGPKGDKGDPTDVQQTTGQSTTAVMSQKATTDELNAIKSDITELQTALIGVSDLIGGGDA